MKAASREVVRVSVEHPKEEWDVWNNTDPRVRNEQTGDIKGKPLSFNIRRRAIALMDDGLNNNQIARQLSIHARTVSALRKAVKEQHIPQVTIDNETRTQGVPVPGVAGGFRWCALTNEQKAICSRIAVENPTYSIDRIRDELNVQCGTSVSSSTVYRTMRNSNIQHMRSKLKDPKAEGTKAHRDELDEFVVEQQKGNSGALAVEDLFFMDETTIYLNETPTYAWGTRSNEPELQKTKGKTMTIAIYAGIALTSNHAHVHSTDRADTCDMSPTTPRCNVFRAGEDGCWTVRSDLPKFCLVWWMRPPERDDDALFRFLDVDDVKDASFLFPYKEGGRIGAETMIKGLGRAALAARPTRIDVDVATPRVTVRVNDELTFDIDCVQPADEFQRRTATSVGSSNNVLWRDEFKELPRTALLMVTHAELEYFFHNEYVDESAKARLDDFVNVDVDADLSIDEVEHFLWILGVEMRMVDEIGELVKSSSGDYFLSDPLRLRTLLAKAQQLVRYAMTGSASRGYPRDVPRNFGKASRNYKGGSLKSTRGDRGLFLRYLNHVDTLFKRYFRPPGTTTNFRFIFDSAPQHGKVDITSNKKSFIHDYCNDKFGVNAIFLPVRKPDYNPVEFLFSFVKGGVRRRMTSVKGEMTPTEMIALLDKTFSEVTVDMMKGWLRYGCYIVPGEPPTKQCALRNEPMTPYPDLFAALVGDWQRKHGDLSDYGGNLDEIRASDTAIRREALRFACLFDTLADVEEWQPPESLDAYRKQPRSLQTEQVFTVMKECRENNRPYAATLATDPTAAASMPLHADSKIRVDADGQTYTFVNHLPLFDDLLQIISHCADDKSLMCAAQLFRMRYDPDHPVQATCMRVLNRLEAELTGRRGLLATLTAARDHIYGDVFAFIGEHDDNLDTDDDVLNALLDKPAHEGPTSVTLDRLNETLGLVSKTPYKHSVLRAERGSENRMRDTLVVVFKAFLFEETRAAKLRNVLGRRIFSMLEDEETQSWDEFLEALRAFENSWHRRCDDPVVGSKRSTRDHFKCRFDDPHTRETDALTQTGPRGGVDMHADNQAPLFDVARLIEERKARRAEKETTGRRWPGYPGDGEHFMTVKTGTFDDVPIVREVQLKQRADADVVMIVLFEDGNSHTFSMNVSGRGAAFKVKRDIHPRSDSQQKTLFEFVFSTQSDEATENKRRKDLAVDRFNSNHTRQQQPFVRPTDIFVKINSVKISLDVNASSDADVDAIGAALILYNGSLYPKRSESFADTQALLAGNGNLTWRVFFTEDDYTTATSQFFELRPLRGAALTSSLLLSSQWSLRPHSLRHTFRGRFYKFIGPSASTKSKLKEYSVALDKTEFEQNDRTSRRLLKLTRDVHIYELRNPRTNRVGLATMKGASRFFPLIATHVLQKYQDRQRAATSPDDLADVSTDLRDPFGMDEALFADTYDNILREYSS